MHCETGLSPPVKVFILTALRLCFFCGPFLLFVFRVCLFFLSVHHSLVVTCWETGPMALLCVMFYVFSLLSHVVSWIRFVAWLYRLLIFAFFLLYKYSYKCVLYKMDMIKMRCEEFCFYSKLEVLCRIVIA